MSNLYRTDKTGLDQNCEAELDSLLIDRRGVVPKKIRTPDPNSNHLCTQDAISLFFLSSSPFPKSSPEKVPLKQNPR